MRVVLAEKPSVARDLARALGCTHKELGFFRGSNDLVTWAVGHLVRFAEPGEMNPAWGKPWRRDALPMLPTEWRLVPEPRTEDQLRIVLRLFRDARVTQIVNATDAGREGEAIFRRIYALSGITKPVLRFWTSSLTEEAIFAALQRLRPAADFDALGAAALARAQVDWLIGMNHSRATTLHNSLTCSVGRVQTPTLAMIVRRHHEIAGFIKTLFYEVHADLGDFVARALNAQQKHDFESKPDAEGILTAIPRGTPALVTTVEIKPRRIPPPQLHNLGELQKEANRRFGLPADRTLAIAQSLYENKAITYPRSSSRHLSEDMVGGLPAVLRALRLGADRTSSMEQAMHSGPQGLGALQALRGRLQIIRPPRYYPNREARSGKSVERGTQGLYAGGGTFCGHVPSGQGDGRDAHRPGSWQGGSGASVSSERFQAHRAWMDGTYGQSGL